MTISKKLRELFSRRASEGPEKDPEAAYDLWASSYDSQPDNLMLALDEELFSDLLNNMSLEDKTVADIGCGTGRHWKKLMNRRPHKLIGFDVSEQMLVRLQQKFPQAITHRLLNNKLQVLNDHSCDMLISTLTIAHIENIEEAITEWNRVLKPGGEMIITDYHPVALSKGGKRSFKYNDQTVAIVNHIHPIEKITALAKQLGIDTERLIEKTIDETTRPYYEKQQALPLYESWKGTPIIYGILFKKNL